MPRGAMPVVKDQPTTETEVISHGFSADPAAYGPPQNFPAQLVTNRTPGGLTTGSSMGPGPPPSPGKRQPLQVGAQLANGRHIDPVVD